MGFFKRNNPYLDKQNGGSNATSYNRIHSHEINPKPPTPPRFAVPDRYILGEVSLVKSHKNDMS